jgi:hypothetical protein
MVRYTQTIDQHHAPTSGHPIGAGERGRGAVMAILCCKKRIAQTDAVADKISSSDAV